MAQNNAPVADFSNLQSEKELKHKNGTYRMPQPSIFNSIEMCLSGAAAPVLESQAHVESQLKAPHSFLKNEQSLMKSTTDEQDSFLSGQKMSSMHV